ncbi:MULTISPECIES: hypothetical protein [Sphingobacterium]|uniref:hypothetical protein n=1 Tax=Sphingobacterium TaxID=28453 RepID=UPI0028A7619E|nr:hypothetical protein [Sphingobacterium multivorum]
MKKLFFFFVAMLITVAAFSQAYSLRVENQTQCTQYYIIFGDEICKCGNTYTGKTFAINPGDVHNYSNSVPLLGSYPGTPKSIVGARILHGPLNCQSAFGIIGEPNCGLPIAYTYLSLNPDCRPCVQTTARWIPANNCQGMARLIFTP